MSACAHHPEDGCVCARLRWPRTRETTSACIRGCSMYRRHLVECEGADDETCRGCLPRRADHGLLCWPCHRRFELMLTDAPTVHRWLGGNMATGQGASRAKQDHERARGGKGAKSEHPPAPIKADVMDIRDLLADRLALWVDDWCEHKGLTGPGRHATASDAAYLLTWLRGVESVEWIGDWWEELAETMRDAHALAPWRPEMKRVHGVPCPECEETNLAIFGGESDVTCLSCRMMIPEKHFGIWEKIVRGEVEVVA